MGYLSCLLRPLTTNIDTFVADMANSTFKGDERTIQFGDEIVGTGSGNVFKAYLSSTAGTPTYGLNSDGVQAFRIQNITGANTFAMTNAVGVDELWNTQSDAQLKFTSVAKDTTVGVYDTSAITDVTYKTGIGSTATTLAVDTAGTENATADIRVHAANSTDKVTALTINAVGGDSNVALANYQVTGGDSVIDTNNIFSSLKTLTITGDAAVKLGNAAAVSGGPAATSLDEITTVNASANTGGVVVNLYTSDTNLTFTGGAGDDGLIIKSSTLTALDSIDMGAGTNTLALGAANSTTSTVWTDATAYPVKGLNAAANVDIAAAYGDGTTIGATAQSTAEAAGNAALEINATKFTSITNFEALKQVVGGDGGAKGGGSGSDGGNGGAGINLTSLNTTTLYIDANVTGGAGGAGSGGTESAGDAGAGIYIRPVVDSGSDAVSLVFNEASTVKGGNGGEATTDGKRGFGLDALGVESVTISTLDATADIIFSKGTGSGGTTGITDVRLGANAQLTLKGAGDITLGTVIANDDTSNNAMTINASEMTGKLSLTSGSGNDTITAGAGADTIRGALGADQITGGAGRDTFNIAAVEGSSVADSGTTNGSGTITTMDTYTGFAFGGGDVFKFGTIANFGNAGTAATIKVVDANTQALITASATLTDGVNLLLNNGILKAEYSVATFTYAGSTYMAYKGNADDAVNFTAGEDAIVKLVGATGTLTSGDVLYV